MVSLNRLKTVFTHEGAPAQAFAPERELKRAVMNCLLWEDQFYEDGVAIAERIAALVPHVAPESVAALAVEARERDEAAARAAAASCARWPATRATRRASPRRSRG